MDGKAENETGSRYIKVRRHVYRVVPSPPAAVSMSPGARIRVPWLNPYLMFLIFVLLVFGFNPRVRFNAYLMFLVFILLVFGFNPPYPW